MIRDEDSKHIENENLLSFFEWLDREITSDGECMGAEETEIWFHKQAEEDKDYFRNEYKVFKSNTEIGE